MADKKRFLTSLAKTRAQRTVRTLTKHFALEEEQAIPAPVAERGLPRSTLEVPRRLRLRPSSKLSYFHFELVSAPPSQKKRRPSTPYDHLVITPVFKSGNSSEAGPSESRRAERGWKRALSSGEWRNARHIRHELPKWSGWKQKHGTSSTGYSPTRSPIVHPSSMNRGSTPVTLLSPWSSNETADCPQLCKTTTSSIAFHPWWLLFGPLLYQTSIKQIFSSPLKKSSFWETSFWLAGRISTPRSVSCTAAVSVPFRRRLQQGTSSGWVRWSLRSEQYKLLTGGM